MEYNPPKNDKKIKLHEEFFLYLEENNISQNNAAKKMGLTAGVISGYKTHKYNGDVTGLEEKIRNWLESEKRRKSSTTIPIIETQAFSQIQSVCDAAYPDPEFAILLGMAGVGKTIALEQYVKRNNNVFLVKIDANFTLPALILKLAEKLGIDRKGNTHRITERITAKLNEMTAMIIIDEAEYLNNPSFEYLRQIIHDQGETSIILAGLPRLEHRLRSFRDDHSQILSRCGILCKVKSMQVEDTKKVLQSVFTALTDDLVNYFHKKVKARLRTLIKLIKRTNSLCSKNKRPVSKKLIDKAAEHMVIPDDGEDM